MATKTRSKPAAKAASKKTTKGAASSKGAVHREHVERRSVKITMGKGQPPALIRLPTDVDAVAQKALNTKYGALPRPTLQDWYAHLIVVGAEVVEKA